MVVEKGKRPLGKFLFFWGGAMGKGSSPGKRIGRGNYMKQKTERPAERQKPEEIQTKIETLMEKQQRRIRGEGEETDEKQAESRNINRGALRFTRGLVNTTHELSRFRCAAL